MPSHATFYFPDSAPLSAEALGRHAADAEVRERRGGLLRRVQGIEVIWPGVRMSFTSMDARELPEHLAGFAGFVRAKAASDPRTLVQRISAVRQGVGGVGEP